MSRDVAEETEQRVIKAFVLRRERVNTANNPSGKDKTQQQNGDGSQYVTHRRSQELNSQKVAERFSINDLCI